MAEISYGAILKAIRVIQELGIDDRWPDFIRAYDLPHWLEPPRREILPYSGDDTSDRRMQLLKTAHKLAARDEELETILEHVLEALFAELDDPGYDHLGRRYLLYEEDGGGALTELEALKAELERSGYRVESGRLVEEGAEPVGPEIDANTGIGNSAWLNREAERILQKCRGDGLPIAAVFIDTDDFKRFNKDGYALGNRVLQVVAHLIERAVQSRGGVVGRYGAGDEIVVVMPNMTEAEAKALGERIRQEVERLDLEGHRVTASVGVAATESGSLEGLWASASTASNAAKEQGKNRIVAHGELRPGARGREVGREE